MFAVSLMPPPSDPGRRLALPRARPARQRGGGARAGVLLARAPTPADLRSDVCRRSWREPTAYSCHLLSCMFPDDAGDAARFSAALPPDAWTADGGRARRAFRRLGPDDP